MPAFQFDSTGIDPHYGAGSSQLPLGKHPVVISASELKPTKDGQGGYMALTLEAIDGPAKGISHVDRLNLHNKNAETVRIANQQLSAYCAVTGVLRFQSTEEMHGKPFVVDIVPDTGQSAREGQTKVGGLFDMQGNDPSKAGAGAPQGGGGFGNASGGQPANNGFQAGQGQPQGQPANGGAWGNQGGGQPNGGGAAATGGGAWSQGAAGGNAPGWGAR